MIRKRIERKARRSGFTLLEVLLVVGILVTLAAIALPNLIGVQENTKINTTRTQVMLFDKAAGLYHSQVGEFPNSEQGFASLTNPPNNMQPFLEALPGNDPWGQPYNYMFPGQKSRKSGPDIWSNGPDRQANTPDDIGNWPAGR